MKKSKFTVEQIVSALTQAGAGVSITNLTANPFELTNRTNNAAHAALKTNLANTLHSLQAE